MKYKNVIVVLLFSLAIFLRFYCIEHQNIWFDESYSWDQTHNSIFQIIKYSAQWDVHPPLYYIILKYWISILGDSTTGMRSLSLVFNIGTMFFVYLILKNQKNTLTLFIALLLMAVSPYQIYFSNETRMYSQLAFFNIASIYYYIKLYNNDWQNKFHVFAFIIMTVFGLYTHLVAIITTGVLLVHFGYKVFIKSDTKVLRSYLTKRFILTLGGIALLFIPWLLVLWSFQAGNVGGQVWRAKIEIYEELYEVLRIFSVPFVGMYYWPKLNGFIICSIFLVLLPVSNFKAFKHKPIITLSVLAPLMLLLIALLVIRRQYDMARYMFSLSPVVIILFAFIIEESNKYIRPVVFVAVLLIYKQ